MRFFFRQITFLELILTFSVPVLVSSGTLRQDNDDLKEPIEIRTLSSEPRNQIGIGLSLVHDQIRDDILCPLRWDGIGPGLKFSYTYAGRAWRHESEIRIFSSFLSNKYDHGALNFSLLLKYGFLREIIRHNQLGSIYLGGLLDWNLNDQYYRSWDEVHMYWLNAYELGPWLYWSRMFGKRRHIVNGGFNLPIIILAGRPPKYRYYQFDKLVSVSDWFSTPHENMSVTSLHEYVAFELRLGYMYQTKRRICLTASLHSNYRSYSKPESFRSFTNMLFVGIIITPGSRRERI